MAEGNVVASVHAEFKILIAPYLKHSALAINEDERLVVKAVGYFAELRWQHFFIIKVDAIATFIMTDF